MDEILQILKDRLFFVATEDGDQPKARPLAAASIIGGELYLFTSREKNFFSQLEKNPKIEIVSVIGMPATWLRLTAVAVPVFDREIIARFLDGDLVLQTMFTPDDGKSVCIKLTEVQASIRDMTSEIRRII